MHPFVFEVCGFHLASYGVLVAMGYAAGIWYVLRRAQDFAFDRDTLWNFSAVLVAGALLGGKVLYVLISWGSMPGNAAEKSLYFLRDIRYGFVFYGGVFGALAAAYWYSRLKKFALLPAADIFAPATALGHAFGRVGCFFAGCCFGRPAASGGVVFSSPDSLVDRSLLGVPLYPVQLYEAGANLLIFLVLHRLSSGKYLARQGAVMALYCILYSAVRFSLEFLRGDDRGATPLGLSPSQWIAIFAVIAAVSAWSFLPRKDKTDA